MTKDKVDLICDVAELAALFEETSSLEEFLDKVVGLVADHMSASVRSVYLYDEREECLVLRATKGLNKQMVGSLRLTLDQGIVGTALMWLRPIREGHAQESPYFKPIPGIQEERYAAMLAVPIVRGATRVGVLAVQHEEPDYFNEHDTRALRAIAVQLAATLENIRLLLAAASFSGPAKRRTACRLSAPRDRGLAGSGGHCTGRSHRDRTSVG